jgi:YebC/PmpR family DNA-binding regulatory protein
MAGHNKWSKVKHIKARVDVIRGRVFSKCAHEIALAARAGGGDPAANARLRTAIENARAVSMPKENIERAVRKGLGGGGGDAIQEVVYEGYGPGGTAFLVEVATDNLNRSAADIRSLFTKGGGSVATPGSVAYQFDRRGEVVVSAAGVDAGHLTELAADAGAEDVLEGDDEHVVLTVPQSLGTVANALRGAGLPVVSERMVSVARSGPMVDDPAVAAQVVRLIDHLEDYEGTVNVFTNFDVTERVAAGLGA